MQTTTRTSAAQTLAAADLCEASGPALIGTTSVLALAADQAIEAEVAEARRTAPITACAVYAASIEASADHLGVVADAEAAEAKARDALRKAARSLVHDITRSIRPGVRVTVISRLDADGEVHFVGGGSSGVVHDLADAAETLRLVAERMTAAVASSPRESAYRREARLLAAEARAVEALRVRLAKRREAKAEAVK